MLALVMFVVATSSTHEQSNPFLDGMGAINEFDQMIKETKHSILKNIFLLIYKKVIVPQKIANRLQLTNKK